MSFFDLFERSAWRLEVQRFYLPDAEEFHRHEQGQDPTAEQRQRRKWWIAGLAGREVGRVLVVDLPLSPYWRWRLETAREHVAVGERIMVADRTRWRGLQDLRGDFWLFDDARVRLLDFDPDGSFIGARDLRTVPALVDGYRAELDQARAYAVPLQEFLLPA